VELLLRCQEVRALVRGARDEARVRAVEEKANAAKRAQDQDRQVEMGFEQVRSIRAMDPRYERREEVARLLKRTAEFPGPRRAEAERMLAEYNRQAEESRKQFVGMVGWYCFKSAEGLGLDSSGQGHDAYSVSGAFSNKTAAQSGPGIRFDGTGMMALPLIIRDDFSISVWVRTSQVQGGGKHWFEGNGLVDAEVPGVVADFGTALLGSKFAFGVGAPDTTWTSKTAINDGQWHHLVATRKSPTGEIRMYVDGAREVTATGPTGPRRAPSRLCLGSLQTDLNRFIGDMDEVRLYARVLDDEEVLKLSKQRGGK
jgi:hypothetical protein